MSHFNCCVDDFHNELSVVSFLIDIVVNSNVVAKNKIVVFFLCFVNVLEDFPHPRSSACGLGLGVQVGQVGQNVVVDILGLNGKQVFNVSPSIFLIQLGHFNSFFEELTAFEGCADFAED